MEGEPDFFEEKEVTQQKGSGIKAEEDEYDVPEEDKHEDYGYAGMEYGEGEEEEPKKEQKSEDEEQERPEVTKEKPQKNPPKLEVGGTISEEQKGWIIKEATMQRIGGTYDFFAGQILKYKRHIQARKSVLESIFEYIDKSKILKATTAILLIEYFKDLAEVCESFHQKSYTYEYPKREESENVLVNMGVEFKEGFQKLLTLRKDVGNEHNRMFKLLKSSILPKIDKVFEFYYGSVNNAQKKLQDKRGQFRDKESKLQKRIDKISKVYQKGRYGDDISEDVFVEMTKFVKEERQMRSSIFDWGKEMQTLRKNIINADYNLMTNVDSILSEYKHFNEAGFKPKKKKNQFSDQLKDQIEQKYLYQKMVTPVDNDYILAIINLKKKKNLTLLKQDHYEQYLNEQFFSAVMGDLRELLKGTIAKVFPLKNPEEDLVRTVSGNLVIYNKKTLEVRNKLAISNTMAEFQGKGRVLLTEKVKGIMFDSTNSETVVFANDDRAEEVMVYLSLEFGKEDV